MVKILAVDDNFTNNQIVEFLIEEYLEENDIDEDRISLDLSLGGYEVLKDIENNNYDIVFLDIMMPKITGLEILKEVRKKNLSEQPKQPKIIMLTALNDEKTKNEASELGANAYIIKPTKKDSIFVMLDKYLLELLNDDIENIKSESSNDDEENDDFFDLDDEFFDLDDAFSDNEDNCEIQKQLSYMDTFNKSHKQIPAKEFIEEYNNNDLSGMIEDLETIETHVFNYIEELDGNNLMEEKDDLSTVFVEYSRFLNIFIEFSELSTGLGMLAYLLENSNFDNINTGGKTFISSYIKAIFNDLIDWKYNVFIKQTAIDVCYINASLLNSCIQLERYIQDNTRMVS